MISNGYFGPITQSGSVVSHTNDYALVLSTLLHIPSLAKKIIFVEQLYIDNNITMTFSPHSFYIKDFSTGTLILSRGVDDVL